MRVWLVTVGEPLPIPGNKDRLHRSGILIDYLLNQGHEVVWWGSTFDHFSKKHHYSGDTVLMPRPGFRMVLLHGCGYQRNVSLKRMQDHRQIGKKFAAAAEKESQKPDVILSSFPTIELCAEAVRYGKEHHIPVLLDVRDLWPDILADTAPAPLRPVARWILSPLFRLTREAFEGASGIIGISPNYLEFGLKYAKKERSSLHSLLPLGYKAAPPPQIGEPETDYARSLGIDPKRTTCWFVGTFGRTYDLAPVIEAARRFQEKGDTELQFVLSGSGENRQLYEKLAAGLKNVVFTGWINGAQIAYLMTVAKIGFAPYVTGAPQGLPNKFFEYLSAGIPIISSLEGEAQELLAQYSCGITYRPGDAGDLANKLAQALGSPDTLKEMGQNGKILFEEQFSADIIYPRLVAFLESHATRPQRINEPVTLTKLSPQKLAY